MSLSTRTDVYLKTVLITRPWAESRNPPPPPWGFIYNENLFNLIMYLVTFQVVCRFSIHGQGHQGHRSMVPLNLRVV